MNTNDALGGRGEAAFYRLMTEFHNFDTGERPLFALAHLGEKWETADYLVELVGAPGIRPFFFAQVKATRRGYSADNTRLNVKMKREDVRRLSFYPAPTYVIGINDLDGKGYIISANGETTQPLSSMSVAYPIDAANRQTLWKEVAEYWTKPTLPKFASAFVDLEWR